MEVSASLFNTLPRANNVTTSSDWPFQGVDIAFWPPCNLYVPVEVVVLKGNYTLQDIHSNLTAILGPDCTLSSVVDDVVFQPSSSEANITGTGYQLGPFQLSVNFTTDGYWTLPPNPGGNGFVPIAPVIGPGQNPPEPPKATPFTPGVYTVAVCDEWGSEAILHVTVNG